MIRLLSLFRGFRKARESASGDAGSLYSPRSGEVLPDVPGRDSELAVATVYRCVKLLSDVTASLPMCYMRHRDGRFQADTGSVFHYLLNVQPCRPMNATDFWRYVVQCILLQGNAYIIPLYDSDYELAALVPVDPRSVWHDTQRDTYTVNDMTFHINATFREDELVHLKGLSLDGKSGVSVLTFARLTTRITQTGDRETYNRFKNGGDVRGVLGNERGVRGFGEYQDKELRAAAVDIDGRFRSGERIVAVPGSVQFSPLSLSSADMQFLETRKFGVREICRFFGVHPSFVYDDTSNNYKSAEMANVAFLSTTLNPLLRQIETELLRKLMPRSLAGKRKFEFDRRGLYACDLDSRVRYQTQTIAAGLYTVNEWRREDNRPEVPGGDAVLVSANLRDLNANDNIQPTTNKSDEKE